jgi:hypothetical protein
MNATSELQTGTGRFLAASRNRFSRVNGKRWNLKPIPDDGDLVEAGGKSSFSERSSVSPTY